MRVRREIWWIFGIKDDEIWLEAFLFFFFFEEMMYENVGNTRGFVEGIEGNRKITKLELEGS